MNTPKIGIIGGGMIANTHLDNLKKSERAEVTWLAEVREDVLQSVGTAKGIPHLTTDYREMLASDSVDAVVVCTPPNTHREIFIAALEAGKHCLVEKPVAMDLADADAMLETAARHPELVAMDASARHARLQPKFRLIRSMIESGELGDIYYMHHNCVFRQKRGGIEYNPTAKWFLNKAIAGGGPLFDWGVYDLSFHLGILGDTPELARVDTLFLRNGLDQVDPGAEIFDVEEHGAAILEFTSGLKMHWERGSNAHMDVPNQTRIYGTKGGLRFGYCSWDSPEIVCFDVGDEGRGKARKKTITVDMSAHGHDQAELMEHFVDVLTGVAQPLLSLDIARKHLQIILQVYEAPVVS